MSEDLISQKLEYLTDYATQLLDRSRELSDWEVLCFARDFALTRYANSVIHQQIASTEISLILRGAKDKHLLTLRRTVNSETDVEELVQELKKTVVHAPELPFFQGFIKNQQYSKVDSRGPLLDEDGRAEIVERAVNQASDLIPKAKLFGKVEILDFEFVIANAHDLGAKHGFTYNDFKVLSIVEEDGKRGFGREVIAARDPTTFDIESLVASAVKISRDTLHAKPIEPKEYEVILRPAATEEILAYSLFGLSGPIFHQGNSAYTDKIGEKLLSEKLIIEDRPLDSSSIIASPVDRDGVATKNLTIIDQGIPKVVFHSALTASQFLNDKSQTTGHSTLPYSDYIFFDAFPSALRLKPGDSTEQEMIEETKEGLLVQTFWYSNPVNPKLGVITGLTRDGLYLVKNGEIKHAVKNLRYTDSFLNFLNSVELISKGLRTLISSNVPTIKLSRFKFTGQSKH